MGAPGFQVVNCNQLQRGFFVPVCVNVPVTRRGLHECSRGTDPGLVWEGTVWGQIRSQNFSGALSTSKFATPGVVQGMRSTYEVKKLRTISEMKNASIPMSIAISTNDFSGAKHMSYGTRNVQ